MVSPPVADEPAHRSGALLDHLSRRIRSRSESVLAPLGMRPRHLLALTLLRELGGSSQQALAKTLEMDGTNIVGLLNELEADDLVARRRSATDRRRHVVELTDAGRARLAEAESALAAVEDEVLAGLDGEQRATLHALLQQASGCPPPTCVEAVKNC
ncbi:MarR family winged helix-turn-helix transcriptional regulator [Allonocardiopsis opalescens]|uniref:DNA-binding MarR family transcriptional regulator n=1 Tax=Allonocardiopsis opalescens TaxID=1144618 RepID=A0A2T0QDQ0_9ACTN|nr:MarR family winged helix-turn-helix transcriptional regulator [Allonocardiopsis opalescens]PRY02076.1 DNA-binding MarR family transcriptional regulator [Allonocardiopsis opalescens]